MDSKFRKIEAFQIEKEKKEVRLQQDKLKIDRVVNQTPARRRRPRERLGMPGTRPAEIKEEINQKESPGIYVALGTRAPQECPRARRRRWFLSLGPLLMINDILKAPLDKSNGALF